MGQLSKFFAENIDLLVDAFDLDGEGNLVPKNRSRVAEANKRVHDMFVGEMRNIIKELVPYRDRDQALHGYRRPNMGFSPSELSNPAVMTPTQQETPPQVQSGGRSGLAHMDTVRSHSALGDPQVQQQGAGGASQQQATASASRQMASMGGSTFGQKAPGIMQNLMRDFGLKDYQAAAIVGNLGHESAGFTAYQEKNPTIAGSRGGAGWAQWTGPRRNDFENYAKTNGLDPKSDEANYGFLKQEIQTKYGPALSSLKQTQNAPQAMRQWEGAYEGSGAKHYDSRLNYTNQALNAFNQSQQASNGSSGNTSGNNLSQYASGNARPGAPSSVERVNPEFGSRIQQMVSAMPPDLAQRFSISSGFRDADREHQVYQTQHQGQSIPTDSYHSHGMAVDINRDPQVQQWINQNGSKYGVGFTINHMPGEDNHLEPTENGQRIPHGQIDAWAQSHAPAPTQTAQTQQPATATATSARPQQMASAGGNVLPIGDSLALGMGKLTGNTQYTHGGYNPQSVNDELVAKAIQSGDVAGKHVILSGGASNAGGNTGMVNQYYPQMIQSLKNAGASNVTVMGVGPYSHFDNYGYHDAISKAAQDNGANYTGPLAKIAPFQGDGAQAQIHPANYAPILSSIQKQSSTQTAQAQPPAPTPTPVTPPQQMAQVQPPPKAPTPPTPSPQQAAMGSDMDKGPPPATSANSVLPSAQANPATTPPSPVTPPPQQMASTTSLPDQKQPQFNSWQPRKRLAIQLLRS